MEHSGKKFKDFKTINKAIILALIEANFKSTNEELNDRLLVAVAGGKGKKKRKVTVNENKTTIVYY